MTCSVSVLSKSEVTNKVEFKRFVVPYEVYLYIRQLESYIKNPEASLLKEVYKERFNSGQTSTN